MSSPRSSSFNDDSPRGSNDHLRSPGDSASRKKQKVTRSRTACLPCRSRRSRCGAIPPHPCPACLHHNLECVWPANDGTTKRGRPRRKSGHTAEVEARQGHVMSDMVRNDPGVMGNRLSGNAEALPAMDSLRTIPRTASTSASTAGLYLENPSSSWGETSFIDPFGTILAAGHNPMGPLPDITSPSPSYPQPVELPSGHIGHGGPQTPRPAACTWRFHGRTAIQSGYVNIETNRSTASDHVTAKRLILDHRGLPMATVVTHILDQYFTHFASRFPFYSRHDVDMDDRDFPFLLYCMGALVSRFSSFGDVALPSTPEHLRGAEFYDLAKSRLGLSLGSTSAAVIHGLLLLAEAAWGIDARTEMWSFMGLAVRLGMDMSLHKTKPAELDYSSSRSRIDRLLFWSILIADYTLCFVEGRPTTIRPEDITQELPSEQDISPATPADTIADDETGLRSPFRHVAEMMRNLGPMINVFNRDSPHEPGCLSPQNSADHPDTSSGATSSNSVQSQRIMDLRSRVAAAYDELPMDMIWNAANLQLHYRAGQGSLYLVLHLWNHTIQITRYLLEPGRELDNLASFGPNGKTDQVTLQSIQAGSWLHCARFAGDMLVLADVIDPHLYLTVPSLSHCFFMGGRCFEEDLRSRLLPNATLSEHVYRDEETHRKEEVSGTIFKAVAVEHIRAFRKGLAKQAVYWQGVSQVKKALDDIHESLPHVGRLRTTEGYSTEAAHHVSADRATQLVSDFAPDDLGRPLTENYDWLAHLGHLQDPASSAGAVQFPNDAAMAESPSDILRLLGIDR